MENIEPQWYVLRTYSGYENVAKEELETMIVKYGLENRIFDIVIPMENVIEEKKGKKILKQQKTMPGYILVKMAYGDDIWHNIIRTRGVGSFTGPKGRPLSLTPDEVQRMRLERCRVEVDIEIGDNVEIVEGPMDTQVGKVCFVDAENGRLKVMLEMLGRETEVELDFAQVRKIED